MPNRRGGPGLSELRDRGTNTWDVELLVLSRPRSARDSRARHPRWHGRPADKSEVAGSPTALSSWLAARSGDRDRMLCASSQLEMAARRYRQRSGMSTWQDSALARADDEVARVSVASVARTCSHHRVSAGTLGASVAGADLAAVLAVECAHVSAV